MLHKIKTIDIKPDYNIKVIFENGVIKIYNAKSLLSKFKELKNKDLFKKAKVDVGGYGIAWNDNIDVSAESVYYS